MLPSNGCRTEERARRCSEMGASPVRGRHNRRCMVQAAVPPSGDGLELSDDNGLSSENSPTTSQF